MKRNLLLIAALLACLPMGAQMLWPIAGAKAGEGIIYKPQQYLDDELVFDDLFITAQEGTVVLAPADGVLEHFSIGESLSLNQSISYRDRGEGSGDNFDAMIARIMENEAGWTFGVMKSL